MKTKYHIELNGRIVRRTASEWFANYYAQTLAQNSENSVRVWKDGICLTDNAE